MKKICFIGAGSTVFCKNVLGDTLLCESLSDSVIALYDIDGERLDESFLLIEKLNEQLNGGKAKIEKYLGVQNRKAALKGADFLINAIPVAGTSRAPSSTSRSRKSTV